MFVRILPGDDGVLRENRCRKLGLGLGFGGFEPQPAELVIPVTAEGNGGYWFRIENESHLGSKNVMIPRNARKIVLELYVSFHGDDEFWYSNPPTRYIVANNLTTGRGNGAFREVFVRIDGNYVASEIPLPVVFSGGINPLFWKPVVAFGAFNMPSYDFDLTPFMGSLLDGKSHNFELGVAHALQFWLLDANLHVWLERGSYKVEAKLSFYQPPNFLETWVYRFKHLDGLFQIITQRSSVATGWVSVSCGNLTTTIARRIGFRNSIMFQRDGTYKVVSQQAKVRTDMMVMSDEGMLIARRKFKGKYPLNIITSALTGEDIDTSVIITNISFAMKEKFVNGRLASSVMKSQKAGGWMLVKDHAVLSGKGETQQKLNSRGASGCFVRNVEATGGRLLRDDSTSDCPSLFLEALNVFFGGR